MKVLELGNKESNLVLIDLIDNHDLEIIESIITLIREYTSCDFRFIAFLVNDWNKDLSPWNAPAIYKDEAFGSGADKTLSEVLEYIGDDDKTYIIGGYSLSALFALYAATKSDRFKAVASASPSLWFPGFVDYLKESYIKTENVYLSLGDREAKTKNKIVASVSDNIKEVYALIRDRGINTMLEWNEGNHFKDVDIRVAKAFAWAMRMLS